MAHGHMIPILDMAKLFSSRGVKATIITTPVHAPMFIQASLGNEIEIEVIKFPSLEAGFPEGCESLDQVLDLDDGHLQLSNFFKATIMLQESLEHLLEKFRPNCLVADMFFPWATDIAAKFDIPRLIFHGTSCFALCSSENMRSYKPFKNVYSDFEPFLIPDLPHQIKLIKTQVPEYDLDEIENDFTKFTDLIRESEKKSYGVIVNSFYDLEPDYVEYYRKNLGRKSWHIGPLLLCNRAAEEKAQRGKKPSIDKHDCLKWLNSKPPKSVIYLCFGSMCNISSSQLHEIAKGLEGSGQQFIWVIRKSEERTNQELLPEGFEERMKKKRGLIIRGWAPHMLILEHKAIGAFVTHCGWNSILEGISVGGVPMVTWPMFAEQFLNEKLVTEVLRIGVSVGAKKWSIVVSDDVKSEAIEKAIRDVMIGEEVVEMRNRAMALKEKARKAVEEEGGSSYYDLCALIQELSA